MLWVGLPSHSGHPIEHPLENQKHACNDDQSKLKAGKDVKKKTFQLSYLFNLQCPLHAKKLTNAHTKINQEKLKQEANKYKVIQEGGKDTYI